MVINNKLESLGPQDEGEVKSRSKHLRSSMQAGARHWSIGRLDQPGRIFHFETFFL
jgi:hypothetical protein